MFYAPRTRYNWPLPSSGATSDCPDGTLFAPTAAYCRPPLRPGFRFSKFPALTRERRVLTPAAVAHSSASRMRILDLRPCEETTVRQPTLRSLYYFRVSGV